MSETFLSFMGRKKCLAMDVSNYFDHSVEYFDIKSENNGIIRLKMYTPFLLMFMRLFLFYVC